MNIELILVFYTFKKQQRNPTENEVSACGKNRIAHHRWIGRIFRKYKLSSLKQKELKRQKNTSRPSNFLKFCRLSDVLCDDSNDQITNRFFFITNRF